MKSSDKQVAMRRQVTWFCRFLAALVERDQTEAQFCREKLATLGIWVEACGRVYCDNLDESFLSSTSASDVASQPAAHPESNEDRTGGVK